MDENLKAILFIGAAALAAVEAWRDQSLGWAGLSAYIIPQAWDAAEVAW